MSKQRKGSHTVSRLTVHLVWATKYRYEVLLGDVKPRCRELVQQDCMPTEEEILRVTHGFTRVEIVCYVCDGVMNTDR